MQKKYDLSNPTDRAELIKYALNISEGKLLEIKDTMFKQGYREHVDDLDVKLFFWLGKDTFDTYIHGMFEYDILEAHYLKIPTSHPYFRELVGSNKTKVQGALVELLPEMVCGSKIRDITLFDRNQMLNAIRKKWSDPKNRAIKSKLEDMINATKK